MPGKSYRVLFLSVNDWGGGNYFVADALNRFSDRIQADQVQVNAHPFGFPTGIRATPDNMHKVKDLVEQADGIFLRCSEYPRKIGTVDIPAEKFIAQWHVGTQYREKFGFFNDLDKKMGIKLRFFCWDLLRLAGPGGIGLGVPLDTVMLAKIGFFAHKIGEIANGGDLVVSHFPSSPEQKRTDLIQKVDWSAVGKAAKRNIRTSIISGTPWMENLILKGCSHIYIDHMNFGYGAVGTASTEAIALGVPAVGPFHFVPEGAPFENTRIKDLPAKIIALADEETRHRLWTKQAEWVNNEVGYKAVSDRLTPLLVDAIEGLPR